MRELIDRLLAISILVRNRTLKFIKNNEEFLSIIFVVSDKLLAFVSLDRSSIEREKSQSESAFESSLRDREIFADGTSFATFFNDCPYKLGKL